MTLLPYGFVAVTALGIYLLLRSGLGLAARLVAGVAVSLALLLTGAHIVADMLTGSGIDPSILFHLEVGIKGAAYGEFVVPIAIGSLAFAAALLAGASVFYFIPVTADNPPRKSRGVAGLILAIFVAATNPGTLELASLAQTVRRADDNVPADFIVLRHLPDNPAPRNFIVLYLEQVERTFLDEVAFPGLMPRLTALAAEGLDFSNIAQVTGTGWSIAGITSGLCGIPLVGAGASNSMSGMDRFMPGATCLGDLLHAEGYHLEHLDGADLDFAGWGNFFRDHGFDSVRGYAELLSDVPEGTELSPWGLHDETLFAIAGQRLIALAAGDQPFGMVLNTLDTHHPRGHAGPACDGITYGDGSDPVLNVLACADQMITDWIADMTAKGVMDNTVLVIASDHLAMPNTVWDQLTRLERRNFLRFGGPGVPTREDATAGSALDMGATLLNLLGYEVPGIGLGRPLAAGPAGTARLADVETAIAASTAYLTSLWSYPDMRDPMVVDLAEMKLGLGTRSVRLPALFMLDEGGGVQAIHFDFYEDLLLSDRVANLGPDQRFAWFDTCDAVSDVLDGLTADTERLCLAYGSHGAHTVMGMPIDADTPLSAADLRAAISAATDTSGTGPTQLTLRKPAEEVAITPTTGFALRSAGFGQGVSYVENLATGDHLDLDRGISLIGMDEGMAPALLAAADTCAYETALDALPYLSFPIAEMIATGLESFAQIAVVVDDSAICGRYEMAPYFTGTALGRWTEIAHRTPYIAIIGQDGRIIEMTGAPETALGVSTAGLFDQSGP